MRNENISLGKERLAFVDMLCKENNISRSQLFQCIVDTLRRENKEITERVEKEQKMRTRKTEDYIAIYATGIIRSDGKRLKLNEDMVFIGETDKEMMAFVKTYLREHPNVELEVRRGRMKIGELSRFKAAWEHKERQKEAPKEIPEQNQDSFKLKELRKEMDTLTKQIEDLNEFIHKYVSHKQEMEYAGYRREKAAR